MHRCGTTIQKRLAGDVYKRQAQVRALVDGMAAGPCKFNIGGLHGAAEGGHQQLPVRLVWIADIVDGRFQR